MNQELFITMKVSQGKLAELIENRAKYCKSHLKIVKTIYWTCYCHDLEIPGHLIFYYYIYQRQLLVLTSSGLLSRTA